MSEEESSVEVRGAMETKERVAVVLHESKLEKTFRAICVNGAILAVGLSLGLVGTALPDLQSRTGSSFEALMKVFVGRGLGFLVGSIASNYLLSLANQACWITSALVVLAVTIATIPNCTSVALLMGTLFLQGAACGVVKAGCGFICRHHFSRVDIAWGKTLFISFAVGAFLAPLLLLPFTGVATSSTFKTGSLRYNEDLPVRTSTVSVHLVPVQSGGVIAPNILARFHRRRRDVGKDATGLLLLNETVIAIGAVETSTVEGIGGGSLEKNTPTGKVGGGNSDKDTPTGSVDGGNPDKDTPTGSIDGGNPVKDTPTGRITSENSSKETPYKSTVVSTTGEGGNKSAGTTTTTTKGFFMEIVRVSDGKVTDQKNSSMVPSPASPAVSRLGSTTPVAEGTNVSTSRISSTVVGTTTTKAVPKKPMVADGEMLSSDRGVADSSKYRKEILKNLKNDVPPVEEPKTVVPTRKTTTNSSTVGNTPLSPVPAATDAPIVLSVGENIDLAAINTSSSSSGPVRSILPSSPSSSSQSPLQTQTSTSTQSLSSPSISSSTQKLMPPSTPVPSSPGTPTPSTPTSSTPSSSTPVSSTQTSQKSTDSPILDSSKPTIIKSTTFQTTSKSALSIRPSDAVTEGEKHSADKPNLGHLWLTKYSYWLAALVVGLSATSFAFYWVLCPRVYQTGTSPGSDDLQPPEPPKVATSCRVPAFFIVTSFHLIYAGLEVTFCLLVTSYAVLRLGWSGQLGVLLAAAYWGSFVTCRVLTFALFRCIRQSLVLLGGLLLCIVVAAGAFVSFQHELCESNAFVWVTVGALGFGMAAILPGSASEIEKVFPRQAELFQMLGSSFGEMLLPPLLGIVMTMRDSIWLAYIVLAAFVLCTVIAVAIRVLVVRAGEGRVPRGARSLPSLENDDLEDVLTNTNDETELLAKSSHSQTGSPLNGLGNGTQAVTQMAIQSLMKNISNTKKD